MVEMRDSALVSQMLILEFPPLTLFAFARHDACIVCHNPHFGCLVVMSEAMLGLPDDLRDLRRLILHRLSQS